MNSYCEVKHCLRVCLHRAAAEMSALYWHTLWCLGIDHPSPNSQASQCIPIQAATLGLTLTLGVGITLNGTFSCIDFRCLFSNLVKFEVDLTVVSFTVIQNMRTHGVNKMYSLEIERKETNLGDKKSWQLWAGSFIFRFSLEISCSTYDLQKIYTEYSSNLSHSHRQARTLFFGQDFPPGSKCPINVRHFLWLYLHRLLHVNLAWWMLW